MKSVVARSQAVVGEEKVGAKRKEWVASMAANRTMSLSTYLVIFGCPNKICRSPVFFFFFLKGHVFAGDSKYDADNTD